MVFECKIIGAIFLVLKDLHRDKNTKVKTFTHLQAFCHPDKTWTTFMDRVHGLPVMDQVHGQFFYFYKKVLHEVNGHSKTEIVPKKTFDETLSTNAHD